MLNQIILVGRIIEIGEEEIIIKVPRSFKNEQGEYEEDNIPITIKEYIFTNVKEYCYKGDIVGIKGHIESENKVMQIVAEKVTFLSSKKEDE